MSEPRVVWQSALKRRADGAKQLAFEELLYAGHGTADLSRKAAALYSATTANLFGALRFWRLKAKKVALALQRAVPAVPAKPPGVQTQTVLRSLYVKAGRPLLHPKPPAVM